MKARAYIEKVLNCVVPAWPRLKRWQAFRHALGFEECLWTRFVYDRESRKLVALLKPETLDALEVSGNVWATHGFKSHSSVGYPSFDVCKDTLSRTFDLVIAEHVLEHVTQPERAVSNLRAMLRPGGHALIVCPFLYRIHADPVDCTRWTETGISNLLTQAGFSLSNIKTGSWGNRSCARAVMDNEWLLYNRYLRSLKNEPNFPVVVWAIAKRDP